MQPKSELSLPGYELAAQVQAGLGDSKILIGTKSRCRYCKTSESSKFRKIAHALPEALGNKWIISVDECDDCNSLFGSYEDALAKSVGGVLTVGGTLGKNNRVRQTGRSVGPARILHTRMDGRRRISMLATGSPIDEHVQLNPEGRVITLATPTGTERFVPRSAYKALVKIGLAIMPQAELSNFSGLVEWLIERDDKLTRDSLIVGLSFGSVGNAPPVAAAALLRRVQPSQTLPYMICIVSIGSVCLQIGMERDENAGARFDSNRALPNIQWTNVLCPSGKAAVRIPYGCPIHLDWSSNELALSPVEAIQTQVNIATQQAVMVPILRD